MPSAVFCAEDLCIAALQSGSPQNLLLEASRAGRLRVVTGDRLIKDLAREMAAHLDSLGIKRDDPLRDPAQTFVDVVFATSEWIHDRPHDATITVGAYLVMLTSRAHADWLVCGDQGQLVPSHGVHILTAQQLLDRLP